VIRPPKRPYQGLYRQGYSDSDRRRPLLGGLIVENLSWRWLFYINVPLGVLAWS